MPGRANLLAGEDPDTDQSGDACAWLRIYSSLLEVNQGLLARVESDLEARTARSLEVIRLERELIRISERRDYWERRYLALASNVDIDAQASRIRGPRGDFKLSRRELQLLTWLHHHPERYFSAPVLAAMAWHEPMLHPEQVRSYVVRLRRILERVGARASIETRRQEGYCLSLAVPEVAAG